MTCEQSGRHRSAQEVASLSSAKPRKSSTTASHRLVQLNVKSTSSDSSAKAYRWHIKDSNHFGRTWLVGHTLMTVLSHHTTCVGAVDHNWLCCNLTDSLL